MSHLILICGNDPVLLSTRKMVLAHGGFQTVVACTPEEIASAVDGQEIHLGILGYALSDSERETARDEVWRRRPEAKILHLAPTVSKLSQLAEKEYLTGTMKPAQLLEDCRLLLES